jgi:hypothetical protein
MNAPGAGGAREDMYHVASASAAGDPRVVIRVATVQEGEGAVNRIHAVRAVEHAVRDAVRRHGHVQFCVAGACEIDPVFARQCINTAVEAGASRIHMETPEACGRGAEVAAFARDLARFLGNDAAVSAPGVNPAPQVPIAAI